MIEKTFVGEKMIASNLRLEAVRWNEEGVIKVSAKGGHMENGEFIHSTFRDYCYMNFYETKIPCTTPEAVRTLLEYAEIIFNELTAKS